MTARQFVLKEPAAIFFIPKLLNSYGHYTMVTSLGVLSKGRIAQAKASVNSQQNDSAGLMELRDLLSHEVVPRTLFPCSLFASAANSPNEFDIHDPLCLVPSSTRQCKKP